MAVQQNSLKYFGGQQSGGDSSARQVVIERTDMTAAFTEDEYQKCLSAISLGYAVAVSWGTGSSKMQAQLSLTMADGSLHFAITLVDLEMVFIVDGGSPHSITAHTNNLGSDQFVLLRTDMATKFTDEEYQNCVDAVTAGKAVCVQYGSNQVQLASVSGGALYFNGCSLVENFQYVVSPTLGNHTITRTSAPIGGSGGDQFVLVRANMTTDFTNQEYQDCVDAITAEKAVCVQFVMTGNTMQVQLTQMQGSGVLVFEFSTEEYHFRYEVSATANAHAITQILTVPARESDIAPDWSSADVPNYAIDTIVYHDYWLYRCKVSNPSNTWVSGEWESVDLATILDIMRQTGWYGITPTVSVSTNFRIKADGSVESAAGYVLNRYYIAGLGGKTIRISSNYNSVFSTTDSASGKVSLGLAAGEYVIPASANYLIVSHTQGSTFDVSVKDFDAVPSNSRSRIHLTYYDSSAGFKIDSSGNAVADANYTLVRYHTDGVPNRTLDIETDGYSVFSTSSSASNRVTPALSAGSYVVPTNGTYLIISVKTGDPFDVWLVTDEPYVSKYGTYGLQMRWSENTTYRLGDAVNKSFSVDNATGEVTSDFDTCYPWCDMKLCNIENPNGLRTITYQGEAGFTFSKDTYVEVPKFYFKRVYDPNTEFEYWFISSKGGDGFELEPWFRNADGSEAQVRYVARYNLASSGNISRTGYAAYWNLSKSVLKTYCESNNVKLMDIHAYQALIHLFVIESGTKDSQSFFKGVSYFRYFTEQTNQQMTNSSGTTNTIVIPTTDGRNEYFGVGDRVAIFQTASNDFNEAIIRNLTAVSYGGGSATLTFDGAPISLTQGVSRIYGINQLNGRTDGISTVSGRTVDGDEHTRSFSYRGIENLWGNLGELVDGITYDYDNHRFKVGNEYLTFETPINRSYIEDTSVPKWIKYFGVDARYPGLTLPCSPLTQTSSTSYTDEWSTFGNESGISDISYGCAWDHQNANGVMCFRNVRDTGNILYTGRAML